MYDRIVPRLGIQATLHKYLHRHSEVVAWMGVVETRVSQVVSTVGHPTPFRFGRIAHVEVGVLVVHADDERLPENAHVRCAVGRGSKVAVPNQQSRRLDRREDTGVRETFTWCDR